MTGKRKFIAILLVLSLLVPLLVCPVSGSTGNIPIVKGFTGPGKDLGSGGTLTVTVYGGSPPYTYKWLKGVQVVREGRQYATVTLNGNEVYFNGAGAWIWVEITDSSGHQALWVDDVGMSHNQFLYGYGKKSGEANRVDSRLITEPEKFPYKLPSGANPNQPIPAEPGSGSSTSAQGPLSGMTMEQLIPLIISGMGPAMIGAAGAIIGGLLGGLTLTPPANTPPPPPASQGGPYVGDKRKYTDEWGVEHEATIQADGHWLTDEGKWIDLETLDAAKKQYQDDQREVVAKQREILERGEDAHTRETKELLERQTRDKKMLDNLQHMQHEIAVGNRGDLWKPGEPGDANQNINDVINQILNREKIDTGKYDAIRKVYEDRVSGKTIDEKDIPTDNQITRETIEGGIEGTSREVFTGTDADGNFSKKSLAVRILAGVVTLGKSEFIYQPVNAGYTMENYVNKGGDSVVEGFTEGVKEVIEGELQGRLIGGALHVGGTVAGVVGEAIAESIPPSITKPIQKFITKAGNVLNTEIKNPFTGERPPGSPKIPGSAKKGPAGDSRRSTGSPEPSAGKTPEGLGGTHPAPKTTAEIMDTIKRTKATGSPNPGLPEPTFRPTGDPPTDAVKGITAQDQKAIKMIADKHGVKPMVRPGNEDGAKWLESGKAHPKPEALKSKTITSEDTKLGFREDQKGLTACKEPIPPKRTPDMSDSEWDSLNKRSADRIKEFKAEKPHLEQLEKEGKINWDRKTGLVTDAKTGKPFAGDNDMYGYADAVTGKPVSPFTVNQINKELQATGATTHNEHLGWDYTSASDVPPVGGGASEFATKAGIDTKILNTHVEGGKPLDAYNPLTGKWEKTWYTGGTQRTFVDIPDTGGITKVLPGRLT